MRRILFTSFYQDPNPVRQKELELCIVMNSRNKFIDKIYIFLEGSKKDFPVLFHDKIEVIESPRPTYRTFFNFVNTIVGPNDISIIANTDIFFDDTIKQVVPSSMDHKCLALSRYHYTQAGEMILHNEKFSQDTWIFKGEIKPIDYCDFHLGIRGCDNRIAYEIHKAGYTMKNPALSIRTIHYHISESRNYDLKAVPKPYLSVEVGYFE